MALVLIADDSREMLSMLDLMLEVDGHSTLLADSVQLTQEILEVADVQVVITDWDFGARGGKDGGLEVVRFANSRTPRPFIVVLSGLDRSADLRKAKLDFDEMIVKSNINQLITMSRGLA